MGKIPDGIFGAMIGTTGNLTGYVLNGQNILRMIPHPNKKRSDLQKANSQKMTVINEFCRPIRFLLKVGFGIAAKGTTKNYYNLAIAYNKKMAMKGEYPNVEIDYPFMRISEGNLMPAVNPTVERVAEGIKFSWEAETSYPRSEDQVMILVYAPGSKRTRIIRYGSKRSVGFEVIHITNDMIDEPLETYISFIDEDRTAVANSIYTGQVNG